MRYIHTQKGRINKYIDKNAAAAYEHRNGKIKCIKIHKQRKKICKRREAFESVFLLLLLSLLLKLLFLLNFVIIVYKVVGAIDEIWEKLIFFFLFEFILKKEEGRRKERIF